MIFKMQRPISPLTGDVLIYNENRSQQGFLPLTASLKSRFRGSFKIYVEGEMKGNAVEITKVVEDQPW